jgi:hypothetical protein
MKCVILQPSYVPWRGYFHQIYKADVFVFYDDVQYDRRGWRNRNRIKTPNGVQWLSIPVCGKNTIVNRTPINQISIDQTRPFWRAKHFKSLQQSYKKAPYFERYEKLLTDFYSRCDVSLANFTIDFTIALARELGIERTKFLRSSDFGGQGNKTDRLLHLLKTLGATHYITGESAKAYLDEAKLKDAGLTFEYMTYAYPEYEQLYPPYDGQVSILDLLFMTGEAAGEYIW